MPLLLLLLLLLLQRFYRLVSDRRLWLVVSPTGRAPESAPGGAGPVYTTLQAAVQASRPGDTIWLSPGFTHSAADVNIPWPLHLLGGGTHPTDTLLSAPLNADCALSFTASGKVRVDHACCLELQHACCSVSFQDQHAMLLLASCRKRQDLKEWG
jgi:hypothetical protein